MSARQKLGLKNESGFTLIEILVVILIVGILASIAVPSFLNQRSKGQDTCAKVMARTMETAMETYYTTGASYVGASPAALNAIENQIPTSGSAACDSVTPVATGNQGPGAGCSGNTPDTGAYCITVSSSNGNDFRIYRSLSGRIVRSCTVAGTTKGGCPTSLTW